MFTPELPFAIGMMWGVIIYSVRLFSSATDLPSWAKPALDGLLALNIDILMDAIAIRLGFWDWKYGFQMQYFGVPYANFWAWFWVVFIFSASLPRLLPGTNRFIIWLVPAGSILVSIPLVLATDYLIIFLSSYALLYILAIFFTLGAALLVVLFLSPSFLESATDPIIFIVPLSIYLYFIIAGIFSGAIAHPPLLSVLSILVLGIALYYYKGIILRWLSEKKYR